MKKYMAIVLCLVSVLLVPGCLAASGISLQNGNATGLWGETNVAGTSLVVSPEPLETVILPYATTVPGMNPQETTVPETIIPETTAATTDAITNYDEYFDYEQESKPTESQISMLGWYMDIAEVVELLGKPHKLGPQSGVTSLLWETNEGNWYYVIVSVSEQDAEGLTYWDALMQHGVCSIAIPYDFSTTD